MKSRLYPDTSGHARHRGWALGVCVFLLLFATSNARSLTVEAFSFDELVQQAEVIVVVTVTDRQGILGTDGYTIYTLVTLANIDVVKGDVPAAVFDLRIPGGVVGNNAQVYPGAPRLEQGQRYVLFIRGQQQHEFFPLVGAYQGVYRVLNDADGSTRVLRADQLGNPVVSALIFSTAPTLETFINHIQESLTAAESAVPP